MFIIVCFVCHLELSVCRFICLFLHFLELVTLLVFCVSGEDFPMIRGALRVIWCITNRAVWLLELWRSYGGKKKLIGSLGRIALPCQKKLYGFLVDNNSHDHVKKMNNCATNSTKKTCMCFFYFIWAWTLFCSFFKYVF